MTFVGLLPLLSPGAATVGALALRSECWPSDTTCEELDAYFHANTTCTSVLVGDPDHLAPGLVPRSRFLLTMAGRFGFGRALFGKSSIAAVTQWDPVALGADATIEQAAAAVLQRPTVARFDDLLVRGQDGGWGVLPAAAVLEALSGTLARQATTDSLTGLANRERLLAEMAQRHAVPSQGVLMSMMFIDLDRFKQVNDVYGHNAGDALLVEVAQRLRDASRDGDLVARLGGDEFALLLSADRATDPATIAQRLLTAITQPIEIGSVRVLIGASIGVAVGSPRGSDPETLLREADLAMYTAKRAGGDRVEVVSAVGTQLAASSALAINDTLPLALAREEFVLHYQPIVRLADDTIASVEALIRWQDPRHGLRPPGDFLPAAQESGLIVAIDCWVMAQACRQLREWDDNPGVTSPTSLNVNLSLPHLSHPGLLDHVLEALDGLEPGRLRLEIPESASLDDLELATPALTALRAAGIKLTLDDVGSGSTTLRHLSVLPIDGIKIDGGFIRSMLINDHDQAIVKLLTDLAHNIGVKVTAEGIETAEQLAVLRELGCTGGQGYFLGRPVPVTPDSRPAWLVAPVSAAYGVD